MHKFNIDTSIIDAYLQADLDSYQTDSIYQISSTQNLFTPVDLQNLYRINNLYQNLVYKLQNFKFVDETRYEIFLGDISYLEETIVVKILVGFPKEIRKIFLEDQGKKNIIFDLANYVAVMDDNDDIITDILDYLSYAICLLIIDQSQGGELKKPIDRLGHALFVTSFAHYISCSKQLLIMENKEMLEMFSFWEYDVLRKPKSINRYLDMILTYNPEMIILGITGKITLLQMSEVEALKYFDDGTRLFMKIVKNNKDFKENYWLMKRLSTIKIILIIFIIMLGISIVPILLTKQINWFFKIIPLIILSLLALKSFYQYQLNYCSFRQLLKKLGLYLLLLLFFIAFFR